MLGEELLAGNEIASLHVGDRHPGQLRIVLRDPFRVRHPLSGGVQHRWIQGETGEREEYSSVDDLHVLVSGLARPSGAMPSGDGAPHGGSLLARLDVDGSAAPR